jgi:hypothetical protein
MKKYVVLAALVAGMPACGLLGNECGDPGPDTFYDVQGLEAGLAQQPAGQPRAIVAAGASVASRDLRLILQLQERYYARAPAPGLVAAAHACDPVLAPAGSRGSAERVDSLSITSRHAYDARHPAGTSLADVVEWEGGAPWPQPSRQAPQAPFRRAELVFRVPPAAAGPQQFRVYYRQTNGEVYTAETVAFTLRP